MEKDDELICDKYAKIVIATEYAMDGKVLEVTPTHHFIRDKKGKIMKVRNENVIRIEVRPTKEVESDA